ncbi:uncharacterized protein EI97DRAFT_454484 [Westerdykella ornata]|uniref:Uncharacterized protein n=1 Tax=Westerdykella ornata TaxID=318751 RepID=A0A6A6JZJ7_WESOR|nr:uncharacterized protein EI97DRAFT_454484 [Westerdykella ornata]KAF2281278.1 hypothetical protein EI97DRAFT_454484 [Westerdykella ornata]
MRSLLRFFRRHQHAPCPHIIFKQNLPTTLPPPWSNLWDAECFDDDIGLPEWFHGEGLKKKKAEEGAGEYKVWNSALVEEEEGGPRLESGSVDEADRRAEETNGLYQGRPSYGRGVARDTSSLVPPLEMEMEHDGFEEDEHGSGVNGYRTAESSIRQCPDGNGLRDQSSSHDARTSRGKASHGTTMEWTARKQGIDTGRRNGYRYPPSTSAASQEHKHETRKSTPAACSTQINGIANTQKRLLHSNHNSHTPLHPPPPSPSSPPPTLLPHESTGPKALPTGLPTPSELYTLLPSPPSRPVSPATQADTYAFTIATQAKLIRMLHREVDELNEEVELLRRRVLVPMRELLVECMEEIEWYEGLVGRLRAENGVLRNQLEKGLDGMGERLKGEERGRWKRWGG